MLVDTHAHLDFPEFADDVDAILHRAKEAGVARIIAIGTTLQSSRKAIDFAEQHPEIYAVVGIHPNSVSEEREDFLSELQELADHPKVVAIGETGLDYHHLPSSLRKQEISETTFGAASTESDRIEICAMTLKWPPNRSPLSNIWNWPQLIEKCRHSSARCLGRHHEDSPPLFSPCSRRCCIASMDLWSRRSEAVELGHYISFTGIVTFKNAEDLRQTAASLPIDRIMVETDAPYLAPVPIPRQTL